MTQPLGAEALDQIFRTARTYNGYLDKPVSTEQLHAIWDLMKMGPTSANQLPARLVWCRTPESKEKLNAGFNSCFNGQPECPAGPSGRGSAAFVLDGVVLLAPAIAVEDMADEVFLIATGLTEREARGLISKINR